jgi:hypothetical protein
MSTRFACIAAYAAAASMILLASGQASASLPRPLTVADVEVRLVGRMPKLFLPLDDWSPADEHVEMLCIIHQSRLVRCRVDAVNAEQGALNWAFAYVQMVRLASLDRHGNPVSGGSFLLKLNFKP